MEKCYKNDIIKYIQNILVKAKRNNMQSKFIYAKILTSLKTYKNEIKNAEDLLLIKYLGDKTKELIVKNVFKLNNSEIPLDLYTNETITNIQHNTPIDSLQTTKINSGINQNMHTKEKENKNARKTKHNSKDECHSVNNENTKSNIKKRLKTNLKEKDNCMNKENTNKIPEVEIKFNKINEENKHLGGKELFRNGGFVSENTDTTYLKSVQLGFEFNKTITKSNSETRSKHKKKIDVEKEEEIRDQSEEFKVISSKIIQSNKDQNLDNAPHDKCVEIKYNHRESSFNRDTKTENNIDITRKNEIPVVNSSNHKNHIKSLDECNKISNFSEYNFETPKYDTDQNSGVHIFNNDLKVPASNNISLASSNAKNKSKKLTKKKTDIISTYIPKYRSFSYAIIRVLSRSEGISKHTILQKSKKYLDIDLTNDSFGRWSCMKTLITKGIVVKELKKYYLTEKGVEIGLIFQSKDPSILEEEGSIKLIIDSREMKSKKERLFFQTSLGKNIECETRNLPIGDFCWYKDTKVLDYIIERKKGSDFIASIMDGRFKEQKNRIKESGIKNVFYIIEGLKELDYSQTNISQKKVISSISKTRMEGFIVLETNDIKHTSNVISYLNNKIHLKEKRNAFTKRDKTNKLLNIDNFIESGTKNSNITMSNVLKNILSSIRGLKEDIIDSLVKEYGTIYNFISNYKQLRNKLLFGQYNVSQKILDRMDLLLLNTSQ